MDSMLRSSLPEEHIAVAVVAVLVHRKTHLVAVAVLVHRKTRPVAVVH